MLLSPLCKYKHDMLCFIHVYLHCLLPQLVKMMCFVENFNTLPHILPRSYLQHWRGRLSEPGLELTDIAFGIKTKSGQLGVVFVVTGTALFRKLKRCITIGCLEVTL